ncbi:MAG: hypothetical protein ACI97A_001340 [Planctomycetota bacterium]|jgi:hypothetical protein
MHRKSRYDDFVSNPDPELSFSMSEQKPDWPQIHTDQVRRCGAHVRFHYRPLPPGLLTKLAWRYGYHTWMELLDADGQPLKFERPVVWGVYEGRHQDGANKGKHNGAAEAKWMIWEYEDDGGLERWGKIGHRGHGYVDHHLPAYSEEDFTQVLSMVYDGLVMNLGSYGYLLPWLGPILDWWNCQRYVRVYCRKRGGPNDLFHDLGRRYWQGIQGQGQAS